ncbi:stage VI sporulation protein F [[Clostridium] spiroforme]|nr:stage VI sporulation protein F [Thomasclavelia spiroformis]
MKNKNELVDKVASKTNLKREDIFQLAHDLQTKDLNNEQDIRNFIMMVAKLTNQQLEPVKVDKLVRIIRNKQVPQDIEKML